MDAEMLAIAIGWKISDSIATHSQAVIDRIRSLHFQAPRPWIEGRVVRAREGRKALIWVKGHAGVMGN